MQYKTKDLWNKLAIWWDEAGQDGDLYHRTFIFPTLTNWIAATKGTRVLDVGCGNGALARLLAKAGADVVAVDFSEVFIERAKKRSKEWAIDYRIIDAADAAQLSTLVDTDRFDYVVSSMVLHDMPIITPFIMSLPLLLRPEGAFIFSVPHPCFNSGLVEIEQLKQQMEEHQLVLPNRYIKPETFEIFSKPGQPIQQISFHRPLCVLFNELFAAGLVMSGFAEPVAKPGDLPEEFLWAKLPEIPPAMISRWEIKK